MPHLKLAPLSLALLVATACPATALAASDAQHPSPRFTGPLVTASVNTMPAGMVNIEPYLINTQVRAAYDNAGHRHEMRAKSRQWMVAVPMMYALSDTSLVQLTLNASRTSGAGMHTDGMRFGDSTVRFQQRIKAPAADGTGLVLALSLAHQFSTGKYHQLRTNPLNATGSGTGRTTFALGAQNLQWISDDHAVRWRGQLAWSPAPGSVRVRNESVYGTKTGFRGYALVGQAWNASVAAEYVLSQQWVLVGEAVWNRAGPTTLLDGSRSSSTSGRRLAPSQDFSLAPAVEYHFSDKVGLIAGVQFTVGGRNNSDYVAPQIALNMAF